MKLTMILAGALALLTSWGAPVGAAPTAAEPELRFAMEVLVLSEDGARLHRVEDRAVGSAGAEVGFAAESDGRKSLVKATGFLDAKGPGVRVVRSADGAAAAETVLRLTDHASAVYELGRGAGRKMVLRVSTLVQEEPVARDFGEYQLRLDGRLIRNRTEVVLSGLSASSSGLIKATSPKLGTLRVSLKKFRGARPVGVIEGRRLSFKLDADDYEWVTDEPIAGPGRWVAWVRRDAGGAEAGRTSLGGAPLE